MIVTMAGQLYQLMIMMICGFVLAFVYDCIRLLRRLFAHSLFYIGFEDALFWLFGAAFFFILVLWLDFGQIRLFLVFGTFIGALLYYAVISPVFLKISTHLARLAAMALRFVFYPVRIVFGNIVQLFEHFVNFQKKLLKKSLKCGKIYVDGFLKTINIILKKF